jgi:protein arginine N-methyltransferase 1
MYSISGYGSMIADGVRMGGYVQALRQAVKPGSVVLDIGTGTGIFALLACRFGARKVYAVEPDDAIQVARETARANGYAGQIEFAQDLSTRVALPERAEVIVSDLRGVLPLFQHHLPAIVDARQRLLAPGGVLIPLRDTLWAAVVEAPDLYRRHLTPWEGNSYGFDMEPARRLLANTWRKAQVTPEQLLTEPQPWAELDYTRIETPNVSAEVTWTVARAGTAHGLSIWFDATLAPGIGFSNAPGAPELIYGSAFFPWPTPVALAAGDTVAVALRANLVGEDYVWRWDSRIFGQGSPGQVRAQFQQSTFAGVPLSPARLQKRAAGHVPTLNEDGRIDRLILTLLGEGTSLGEIASRVAAHFPHHFATWQSALTRVGDLSEKYSQ